VERQLGYSRQELLDKPVDLLVPVEVRSDHGAWRDGFMQHPLPRRMGAGRDLHALAKDGSLLPVEIGLNPVTQGGRKGALATIVDISERKDLEWRAQMLASEVQHRSRNLLTVVQALAQRMLPRAEGKSFVEILAALARTHELVGTATMGPLRAIIEAELAPFHGQCELAVSDLLVNAKVAQDITLIIHELAINSVKYGALSRPEGRVRIQGIEQETTFRLVWEESGGPEVAAPKREGLGKIILHDLAQGFGASVKIDYERAGFRYELAAPLDRLSNVTPINHKLRETG
jgi:PAS domain S-box-containing protein